MSYLNRLLLPLKQNKTQKGQVSVPFVCPDGSGRTSTLCLSERGCGLPARFQTCPARTSPTARRGLGCFGCTAHPGALFTFAQDANYFGVFEKEGARTAARLWVKSGSSSQGHHPPSVLPATLQCLLLLSGPPWLADCEVPVLSGVPVPRGAAEGFLVAQRPVPPTLPPCVLPLFQKRDAIRPENGPGKGSLQTGPPRKTVR